MRRFIRVPWCAWVVVPVVVVVLSVATSLQAFANTVTVYDDAHVLDSAQVTAVASALPYAATVYTTGFQGSSGAFARRARSHVTSSTLIVLAVDTIHHYVAVDGGKAVRLSATQYRQAVDAFTAHTSGWTDYTGAMVAALQSLGRSLGVATAGGGPAPLLVVGLIVLAVLLVIGAVVLVWRRHSRKKKRGYIARLIQESNPALPGYSLVPPPLAQVNYAAPSPFAQQGQDARWPSATSSQYVPLPGSPDFIDPTANRQQFWMPGLSGQVPAARHVEEGWWLPSSAQVSPLYERGSAFGQQGEASADVPTRPLQPGKFFGAPHPRYDIPEEEG